MHTIRIYEPHDLDNPVHEFPAGTPYRFVDRSEDPRAVDQVCIIDSESGTQQFPLSEFAIAIIPEEVEVDRAD